MINCRGSQLLGVVKLPRQSIILGNEEVRFDDIVVGSSDISVIDNILLGPLESYDR